MKRPLVGVNLFAFNMDHTMSCDRDHGSITGWLTFILSCISFFFRSSSALSSSSFCGMPLSFSAALASRLHSSCTNGRSGLLDYVGQNPGAPVRCTCQLSKAAGTTSLCPHHGLVFMSYGINLCNFTQPNT